MIQPDTGEAPVVEPSRSVASSFGAASGPQSGAPSMIGDFFGVNITPQLLAVIGPGFSGQGAAMSNPFLTRTFKIVENESPVPQDRFFTRFSGFTGISDQDSEVYRYVIGFEHVLLDGRASIGMQLPFFSVTQAPVGDSNQVGNFGVGLNQQADAGDLTINFKYVLRRSTDSIITSGVAVTAPTGPNTLADIDPIFDTGIDHAGTIQPYLAFLRTSDAWFLAAFSALDVPFDGNDATLWFNDLGIGYYAQRDSTSLVTAVIPKFEVHTNTVMTNKDFVVSPLPAGPWFFTPVTVSLHDQVNLTLGVTFQLQQRSTFTVGYVQPVAGPQPFDYEIQAQFNVFPNGIRGLGTGRAPGRTY